MLYTGWPSEGDDGPPEDREEVAGGPHHPILHCVLQWKGNHSAEAEVSNFLQYTCTLYTYV